jgi:hypothetical protein
VTLPYRSDDDARPEEVRAVLARLAAAGTPWLAVTPRPSTPPPSTSTPGTPPGTGAVVIDPCDLSGVPLTVDPFQPAPGCPVHTHIERLAGLLEAAFRPSGPVRAAIRLALRRVYADRGWDLAAGGALPGAAAPPGIPTFAELRRATMAAAADLGCDPAARASVRAFLDVTLAPMWTGQTGMFLDGGHPADVAAMLNGTTMFLTGGIAADDAAAFLTGVFLLRLAGHVRASQPNTRQLTVVVAVPAGRLRRVLDEVRAAGAKVLLALPEGQDELPITKHAHERVPLLGRRSAACGLQCRQRPCTGHELHNAELRAAADGQVWLRLWVQTLVLAFITGRPLPHVPQPLRQPSHQPRDARARECLLATVVEAAVESRALALRHNYLPERLTAAVSSVAAGQLARASQAATQSQAAIQSHAATQGQPANHNQAVVPPRAGHFWVIPQLRWLHEAERVRPLAHSQPLPDDIAPPLEFGLTGLVDWPGISVGDRLSGLYRHRLSMEQEHNRVLATIALLGAEPENGIGKDLVIVGIGRDQPERLRYAARMLGIAGHGSGPGWLEVVLSWPGRLITTREPDLYQAATG